MLLAVVGAPTAAIGLAFVAVALALGGLLNGPMDIGLFTIRQRRTDPAWMGRAFAVSMGFNFFLGYPIGTALAGVLAAQSIELAIVVGAIACVAAAVTAIVLIPRHAREPRAEARRAAADAARAEAARAEAARAEAARADAKSAPPSPTG